MKNVWKNDHPDKVKHYKTEFDGICLVETESYQCFEYTPGTLTWEWVKTYDIKANRFLNAEQYELVLWNVWLNFKEEHNEKSKN